MKLLLLCAALLDEQVWRVRSVRPRNAVTQALVGHPLLAEDLEAARRSFDAPPGGRLSVSVTVTYLERCEAGEADVVFRSFRFRLPYVFKLVPTLDAARSWARSGVDWHRDWARGRVSTSYLASATSEGFRQAGSLTIRGDRVESRLVAGNGSVSARVMAQGPAMWQRPLLPAELSANPEFKTQIDAALSSAESMLRIEHYARDPAFQRLARGLEALEQVGSCLPASFRRRLRSARREGGAKQYGLVDALLGIDVAKDCAPRELSELRADFAGIDRRTAALRAAGELAELRELTGRLLYRTPLIAVRPVAVVEAIVSGKRTALPGVGGGARVVLLNWIEATAGYSWRIRRRAGEPLGMPFVEMRFPDPFE